MTMQLIHHDKIETLSDKEYRCSYARLVTNLMNQWKLDTNDQLELLGLNTNYRSALTRYRKGAPLAKNRDLIERVALLLDLHAQLRLIFPHNPNLAYGWMTARIGAFKDMPPVEVVKEYGIIGLNMLHHYLDNVRDE